MPLSTAQTEEFKPIGDLRKDFISYCILDYGRSFDVKMDTIRGIQYRLEKEEEDSNNEKIEDLSNLKDEDLDFVVANVQIRPEKNDIASRYSFKDVLGLSKAISVCVFQIQAIDIGNAGLSKEGVGILCQALRSQKKLRSLRIEFNPMVERFSERDAREKESLNDDLLKLPQQASNEKAPKGAKKGKQPQNDGPKFFDLPDSLKQGNFSSIFITSAVHISLRSCNLQDSDADYISTILRQHGLMISLNLWGNKFTDVGATKIADALRTNHSLLSLNLGMNQFTDEGCNEIAKSFQPAEFSGLETIQEYRLHAYNAYYGSSTFVKASDLPIASKLISAILGKKGKPPKTPYSAIEWDDAIEIISQPDENQKKPKKGEPEPEVAPLTMLLPGNTRLKYLNLSANPKITNASVSTLVGAIKQSVSLEQVNLKGSSVDNDHLEMIEQAFQIPVTNPESESLENTE